MKFKQVNLMSDDEFDKLVQDTYGKPYRFQQQDGCKERGTFHFSVPENSPWDHKNDTITENTSSDEMGVSFKAWLERNPKQSLKDECEEDRNKQWLINIWWERNFYPDVSMIVDDLGKRGLLPEGDYVIDIDW